MSTDTQLDLAVGYCSDPNCKIRERARQGILPDQNIDFVHLDHTRPSRSGDTCQNPQMHVECFEAFEEFLMNRVRSKTLNKNEKRKAIWDKSRAGKYDMVQGSCVCTCGGLFIPVMTGARHQISTTCVEITPPTTEKKRRDRKKSTMTPRRLAIESEDENECDDEELMQYMYRRDLQQPEDKECEDPIAVPDVTDAIQTFPELPFSGALPAPKKWGDVQKTSHRMPNIVMKNSVDFTCVTVDKIRHKEWIGWILGSKGARLKKLDGMNNTLTRINDSSPDVIRVMICKANARTTKENRLEMAERVQQEIVKVLTRV